MTFLNKEVIENTFGGTNNVIGGPNGETCTETPFERAVREMLGGLGN